MGEQPTVTRPFCDNQIYHKLVRHVKQMGTYEVVASAACRLLCRLAACAGSNNGDGHAVDANLAEKTDGSGYQVDLLE